MATKLIGKKENGNSICDECGNISCMTFPIVWIRVLMYSGRIQRAKDGIKFVVLVILSCSTSWCAKHSECQLVLKTVPILAGAEHQSDQVLDVLIHCLTSCMYIEQPQPESRNASTRNLPAKSAFCSICSWSCPERHSTWSLSRSAVGPLQLPSIGHLDS